LLVTGCQWQTVSLTPKTPTFITSIDETNLTPFFTPTDIRKKGGALFGDFRYQNTFIYHNGADSYYGSSGFRGYRWI
jgi:hypothetical protein